MTCAKCRRVKILALSGLLAGEGPLRSILSYLLPSETGWIEDGTEMLA